MFKPFSLSEAINSAQTMQFNDLKLATLQDAVDRRRDLKQMAATSIKPTYGETEGPPTAQGQRPEIQTGTEYDPRAHKEKLQQAGEMEVAAKVQDHIGKMEQDEREDYLFRASNISRSMAGVKDEETFNERQQEAIDKGWMKQEDAKPFSPESLQMIQNVGRAVDDIYKTAPTKPPTVRNFREGEYIVNKQFDPATEKWVELSRGKATQQQINLRNKPSEVAAGKEFNRILDQSNTAEDQLAVVHRAKALLPTIETGKMQPIKKWAREWGDAFGVPIDTEKMVDAVSFRATMKRAVLDGMSAIKGTASEADRKTVEDSVAALDSPEMANQFLLDVSESMSRRKIEQANFWDRYASANNSSLLGAKSAWSKRISDIPLVKQVKGDIYHYYQFKDQVIEANRTAFRNATEEEVNKKVDDMWMRGK
jgi:hypothetical protein